MKYLQALLLTLLLATAGFGDSRKWEPGIVINMTETDVTSELRTPRNTLHYTIETQDKVYYADYSYKPTQQSRSSLPDIAVNVEVRVAIEGHTVYILDTSGKEVKLHVTKKAIKK